MVNRISDSVVNVPHNTSIKTDIEPVVTIPIQNDNIPLSKENAEQEHLPAEKAKRMTDSMNNFLETTNTELRFKYHEELETYYVTLINLKTDEVVREIPSKKLMDMYAAMCDFDGLFVDKKI